MYGFINVNVECLRFTVPLLESHVVLAVIFLIYAPSSYRMTPLRFLP